MCFVCSKEPSHRDGSFKYPQHMFWLRNKKINFILHRDGSFEYPQHMFWLRNKKINFSYALLSGGLKSFINIGDIYAMERGAIVA